DGKCAREKYAMSHYDLLHEGEHPSRHRPDWVGFAGRRSPAIPPSTGRTVPVVEPDSGLARYAIARATSTAGTSRPVGWRAASLARSACGSCADSSRRATQGVSAVPGVTQFTRI